MSQPGHRDEGGDQHASPRDPTRTSGEFEPLGDLLGGVVTGTAAGTGAPPAAARRRRNRPPGLEEEIAAPEPVVALAAAWPEVVGADVAANSQPVQLKQGRLVVAVSSPAWAQTLQFLEQTIASGLNDRLDGRPVERISFRHAGWLERADRQGPAATQPAQEPGSGPSAIPSAAALVGGGPGSTETTDPTPVPELTAEQQAALRAVEELELEPQLARSILAAMRAAFVREQRHSVR